MCIRDSQNTVEQRVDDGLAGHLLGELIRSVGGNVALQGFVAVSYTHLDLYKRQLHSWAQTS